MVDFIDVLIALGAFAALIAGFELLGHRRKAVAQAYQSHFSTREWRWGRNSNPAVRVSSPAG